MNCFLSRSRPSAPLSTFPLSKFSALLSSSCAIVFVGVVLGAAPQELLVGAAADLASAQPALEQAFLRATGIRVRFTLASSGILARQIAQGAPYDVYLSANERFVKELAASGHLVPDSVRTYALGRVGLWSKSGRYKSLSDLASRELRHLALPNPVHAPYGAAARQALETAGLWKQVEPGIVFGENVQQAMQYAESGNADAVLTAWSLVYNRGGVLIDERLHSPIRQAGGVIARSSHREAAGRFLDFLGSPAGQEVLREYGLFPPGGVRQPGAVRPRGR